MAVRLRQACEGRNSGLGVEVVPEEMKKGAEIPISAPFRTSVTFASAQLKELPHPHVRFAVGLLNLKPVP